MARQSQRQPGKRLPPALTTLLGALATGPPEVLRTNLIGVYLIGSLAQGAFDARYSDADALAVTRRNLSSRELARLAAWTQRLSGNPWLNKLELSIVRPQSLLRADPRGCLLKRGRLARCGWDGNAVLVQGLRDCGVALYGPPAAQLAPAVPPELLRATLRSEAEYLRAELADPGSRKRGWPCYRAYAVLTACRILYTHATGRIAGKPAAARWARRRLPARYCDLVALALANRAEHAVGLLPLRSVRALVAHCLRELGSSGG